MAGACRNRLALRKENVSFSLRDDGLFRRPSLGNPTCLATTLKAGCRDEVDWRMRLQLHTLTTGSHITRRSKDVLAHLLYRKQTSGLRGISRSEASLAPLRASSGGVAAIMDHGHHPRLKPTHLRVSVAHDGRQGALMAAMYGVTKSARLHTVVGSAPLEDVWWNWS